MFASSKAITTKVTSWRFLQQHVSRYVQYETNFTTVKSYTNNRVLFRPTLCHRWESRNNFLNPRHITWGLSCACHGKTASANTKNEEESGLNLKVLLQSPKPALYLGFSGLIPFLSAPVLMAATNTFYPEIAYAQVVYGASIVSFLGGARWGFSLPDGSPAVPSWKNLGHSVVPSLLAWMALLCRDDIVEGAMIIIMGLGLSLHYDLTLLPGYPAWFKALRTILTLVATFSLVATLALKNIFDESVK